MSFRRRTSRRRFILGGALAVAGGVAATPLACVGAGRVGWWLTNKNPPEVRFNLPETVARGLITIDVDVEPLPGWEFAEATLDDRPIQAGLQIPIDTREIGDGSHTLRIAVRDGSLRRNLRLVEGQFFSDNTPPRVTLDTKLPGGTQGRTAIVQVRTDEPVTIDLEIGKDQKVNMVREGPAYVALVGIDALADPGLKPVRLVARDQAGNESVAEAQFEVSRADFPNEAINLPPDMLRWFTSGEYDNELKRIHEFYAAVTPQRMWDGQFEAPAKGVIASGYGIARTYNGGAAKSRHLGTDFDIPVGTPVNAVAKGKVTFADKLEVRGNAVIIDHGVGVHTTYYHLDKINVKRGDIVNKGQQVALSGNTGLTTAPHLHLEVRIAGIAVEPLEWLRRRIL